MSAPPLLSIVIVAYKSRAEIEGCLTSLPREFDGRPVEIILVDNSSGEDAVGPIVRTSYPWVNYVAAETNLGFGRANNLGYARSKGEYVLFLNPDTICNDAALAHCITRLRGNGQIGLVSPKLVQADGTMDLACRRSIPT